MTLNVAYAMRYNMIPVSIALAAEGLFSAESQSNCGTGEQHLFVSPQGTHHGSSAKSSRENEVVRQLHESHESTSEKHHIHISPSPRE